MKHFPLRSAAFIAALRRVDRLIWIAVLASGAGAAAAYARYHDDREGPHGFLAAVLVVACSAYTFCALCGSRSMKLRVLTATISACFALYSAEGLLMFSDVSLDAKELRLRKARSLGVAFDTRNRIDVVRANRKAGGEWHVAVAPAMFFGGKALSIGRDQVLPLAGIPRANIVLGNEEGRYSIFRSDELGFNGPTGIWPSREPIQAAFVGDSFTIGAHVSCGAAFADLVRRKYPRTVNLASVGNGPLMQLATIREYLRDRRVETIFWMYYEGNDLEDLAAEATHPILRRYLRDPDYSQKLVEKQALITAGLRRYLLDAESRLEGRANSRTWPQLWRHATLRDCRTAALRVWNQAFPPPPAVFDLSVFCAVLKAARRDAAGSQARLVFVYLPEFYRYQGGTAARIIDAHSGKRYKEQVLALMRSLAIDCIDIEPLFARHPKPLNLFPFGLPGHYTREGHEIVARAILEYFDRAAPDLKSRN